MLFLGPSYTEDGRPLAKREWVLFRNAVLYVLGAIALGVAAFGDTCDCGWGDDEVKGCDPTTMPLCKETGGDYKSYVDAFYLSISTLTTVGFGDLTPHTPFGRLFAIFWMVIGVLCVGNLAGATGSLLTALSRKDPTEEDFFKDMDENSDGTITKQEFVIFVLIQMGRVERNEVDKLRAQFDKMDASSLHQMSGSIRIEHAQKFVSKIQDLIADG